MISICLEKYNLAKQELCKAFLNREVELENIWLHGDESTIFFAVKSIEEIPINMMFSTICKMDCSKEILPADVPQFSNYYDAVERLPQLLLYSEGYSDEIIGYQLKQASTEYATTKYGENHSKLGQSMGLIIRENGLSKISPLGKQLVKMTYEEKHEFLIRMLLRQPLFQILIKGALNGGINYWDVVKNLAYSTGYRRRTNVKFLMELICYEENGIDILNNINW